MGNSDKFKFLSDALDQMQADALLRQLVGAGRLVVVTSHESQVGPSHVVDEEEHDIGSRRFAATRRRPWI